MSYRDRQGSGDFAESWQPDEGDEIMGIVQSVNERTQTNAQGETKTYPIATVRVVTGSEGSETATTDLLAIHGACKVLADDIAKLAPGDFFVSRFDGERKSKAGFRYWSYANAVVKVGDKDFPESLKGELPPLPDEALAATQTEDF